MAPASELAGRREHSLQEKSFKKKMFLNDYVCVFAWPSMSVEIRASLSGIKLRVQLAPVITEPSCLPEKGDVNV